MDFLRSADTCSNVDYTAFAWIIFPWDTGPRLNIKTVFPGMGIPMLKISLIFNIGIPTLVRRHPYIETRPLIFAIDGLWQ